MSVSSRDPKVCIYYLKGSCAFGTKCHKTHEEPLQKDSKTVSLAAKKATSLPSSASFDVCPFYLKRKCAFGDSCLLGHPTGNGMAGMAMNGASHPNASLQISTSSAICSHFLVGKCGYGDSCLKLHSSPEDQIKITKIEEARAEIDDLLFGRLNDNDTNDKNSCNEQRNVPKQMSERLGLAEKPSQRLGVAENPSQRLGVAENPSQRLGVAENPSQRLGVPEKPSQRLGVAEKPSQRLGVAEKTTNPREAPFVQDDSDEDSFTEVRSMQRHVPKQISERLGVAEKPSQGLRVAEKSSQRLGVAEKPSQRLGVAEKPSQRLGVAEKPSQRPEVADKLTKPKEAPFVQVKQKKIKEPIVHEPVGKIPGTLRLLQTNPSKTKDAKQPPKSANPQDIVKGTSSTNKAQISAEKATKTNIPKPEVLPDLDKKENGQSEENADEKEEIDVDNLEGRKLTKKEQKRQDRFLMILAKKNLKQQSCEINPEVKDQMITAFNLLEQKKTDEAIETFNKIINELSWRPYHKEALLGLCRCYREMDNHPKALEYVTSSMSKDSSHKYFIIVKHKDEFAIEIATIQLTFGQVNSARKSLSSVSDTNLLELVNTFSQNLAWIDSELNQLVMENYEKCGACDLKLEEFKRDYDKHFEKAKLAVPRVIAKVRESMSIAKKFMALRLIELECYIMQNLKEESDRAIAEIRKEDLHESDSKKLDVLLLLYEYMFVFEWSYFPKIKPMRASPIINLANRFDEASNKVDGTLYPRWNYYKYQVFPNLKELETLLLIEALCLGEKKCALFNLINFNLINKGFTSRVLALLARIELGPEDQSAQESTAELSFTYSNNSIGLRPSHVAYFDRGRANKVLGRLKEAEEDFRLSIYHKNSLQFSKHVEFFY